MDLSEKTGEGEAVMPRVRKSKPLKGVRANKRTGAFTPKVKPGKRAKTGVSRRNKRGGAGGSSH